MSNNRPQNAGNTGLTCRVTKTPPAGDYAMSPDDDIVLGSAGNYTLPSSPEIGDTHLIVGATGTVTLHPNVGQTIGGSAASVGIPIDTYLRATFVGGGNWVASPSLSSPPNFVQSINGGGAIGPADPIHFDSPPISPTGCGVFSLDAEASGTMTAQNVIGMTLLRDGVTPLPPVKSTVSGGVGAFDWELAISWYDQPGDGLPHFYRMQLSTAGATTETIPINGANWQIAEL